MNYLFLVFYFRSIYGYLVVLKRYVGIISPVPNKCSFQIHFKRLELILLKIEIPLFGDLMQFTIG